MEHRSKRLIDHTVATKSKLNIQNTRVNKLDKKTPNFQL